MAEIGYSLSSEEHSPKDLIQSARRAEEVGFTYALISDHFHPWISKQGHSPFVWSVIGAIAQATTKLRLGTGVTCPIGRYHPAIVAQAAATVADMMPGRFFLGIGSGENLNEHITGEGWPPAELRLEMMEEAVEIIRLLWEGGEQSFYGDYFTVENARLYTLPAKLPDLMIAASGQKAATIAGEQGDGLIGVAPDKELISTFNGAGGTGKPRYGQLTVAYAATEQEAARTALEIWPNAAIKGALSQELPLPLHFEQAAQMVKEADIKEAMVCGPDPQKHIQKIQEYIDSGYSHVYIHQIGDQESFFRFYQQEILPKFK